MCTKSWLNLSNKFIVERARQMLADGRARTQGKPEMKHQMPIPEIVISAAEHRELLALAMAGTGLGTDAADDLLFKLERTRMLADQQMPVDVVRMGSTVTYRPDNGDDREVTLVLPAEADISEGRISVLTPVGTALIGLRTGQSTTWTARNGRDHVLRVLSVHQPAFAD